MLFKQTRFPDCTYSTANAWYVRIAGRLVLGGNTRDKKGARLIVVGNRFKKELTLSGSIRETGMAEKAFYTRLDALVAHAFDDPCTDANPRYPLISKIKDLFLCAYEGQG